MPWISFPSKYGFMDRLVSDNILATCICTENPPNPNINATNGNNVFSSKESIIESFLIPLVISSNPFNIPTTNGFETFLSNVRLITSFSTAKKTMYPQIKSSVDMLLFIASAIIEPILDILIVLEFDIVYDIILKVLWYL